jgi:hypothetical protein
MFPVAPTMDASVIDASLPSLSSGSTSLLVQAMASFGTSGATLNSALAFLGGDPSQQTPLAASLDRHLAHS